jgi:hypothetical protein
MRNSSSFLVFIAVALVVLVGHRHHSERLLPGSTDTLSDIIDFISIVSHRLGEVIVLNFIFRDVLHSDVAIGFLVVGDEVFHYLLDGLRDIVFKYEFHNAVVLLVSFSITKIIKIIETTKFILTFFQ